MKTVKVVRECWVCGTTVTSHRAPEQLRAERDVNVPQDITVCAGCEMQEPANDRK